MKENKGEIKAEMKMHIEESKSLLTICRKCDKIFYKKVH